MSFLRLAALGAVIGLLLPACKEEKVVIDTEILLEVSSDVPVVQELEVFVRNVAYGEDRFYTALTQQDLRTKPYVLSLKPPQSFGGELFIRAYGYVDGVRAMGGALVVQFKAKKKQTYEVRLTADHLRDDGDGDGFVEGLGAGYDCDDRNNKINPFTEEKCGDGIDNNCSGYPPDEGCPCVADVPCTTLPEEFLSRSGIGICRNGVLKCENGTLARECTGGFQFTTADQLIEAPGDFLDNDCDGAVDEGATCNATVQASRPCFLGWVDDNANTATTDPDFPPSDIPPGMSVKQQASLRARGECGIANTDGTRTAKGRQVCVAGAGGGTWSTTCDGEVRPQKRPRDDQPADGSVPSSQFAGVGYIELKAFGQCDGKDNDCDGFFDEDGMDTDGDSFTGCGTQFRTVTPPGGTATIVYDVPGLSDDFLDCDDNNADVNPGEAEQCGNTVDEDCRCDHDDPTISGADEIGSTRFHVAAGGTGTAPAPSCRADYAYIVCDRDGDRYGNPAGLCSDTTGETDPPYYAGFARNGNGDIYCYFCSAKFGDACDSSTLACMTKVDACTSCPQAPTGLGADQAQARPMCTAQVDESCKATRAPEWMPEALAQDTESECNTFSCNAFYHGIVDGQCFKRRDPADNEVGCAGLPLCDTVSGGSCCDPADPASCCQVPDEICPTLPARPTAEAVPTCQFALSGCSGVLGPTYSNQAPGEDRYSQCNVAFNCSNDGGNPNWYNGISGSPAYCYFRDNVTSNACDGSGACQDRAEACGAVVTGTQVVARTVADICKIPTSGCSGTTGPVYGDIVTPGTDPYNDCNAAGGAAVCCQGACCMQQGEACGSTNQCQPGLSCVDGVCCESACDGVCNACSNALTGQASGLCRAINSTTTDTTPANLCTGTTGCSGTTTACACGLPAASLGGQCLRSSNSTCTANGDCASGNCECADATCTAKKCSPVDCDCRQNIDGNSTCDGPLNDGVDDVDNSCGASVSCNGSGVCNLTNGTTCTADVDCESNHCECTNAACTTRACAPSDCDCRFGTGGACTTNLTSNTEDAEDCEGSTWCVGGSCLLKEGQNCTLNSQCGITCRGGFCSALASTNQSCDAGDNADCVANNQCLAGLNVCRRVDSQACTANNQCVNTCLGSSCAAKSGTGGTCDASDSGDCATNNSCLGTQCRLDNGQACSLNSECFNVCVDPSGPTTRQCADSSNTLGVCDTTDGNADCLAGHTCNSGSCLLNNGGTCTTNNQCDSGYCIVSSCGAQSSTNQSCDETADCTAGHTCSGGLCKKNDGEICSGNNECGTNQCECGAPDCAAGTRRCAQVDCNCKFVDANGACVATNYVNDTQDDADNTCVAQTCDGQGGCNLADGTANCGSDYRCESNQCECGDVTCSVAGKRCAQSGADCSCTFVRTTSPWTCAGGNLNDGVDGDQVEDCVGSLTCNGQGACNLGNGSTCTANFLCETNQCECTGPDCSVNRECAAGSTVCCFDANNDGDCVDGGDGNLTDYTDDPEDCAPGVGCSGADCVCRGGQCKRDNSQSCSSDADCATGNCECTNAGCTTRACTPNSRTCCYDGNADGDCADAGDGALTSGVEDPEDCDGSNSCNGTSGVAGCKKDNAQVCAGNSECVSAHCECVDASCSVRECASGSTTCCVDSDNNGTCDGALSSGIDDPEDCDGVNSCNGTSGAAGCKKDAAETCTANSDCVIGHCECIDTGCAARECSAGSTTCCVDANNDGVCDSPLASGTNDPEDCDGANSCNGSSGPSGCTKDNGQVCTSNAECVSTHCECVDASCGVRECAAGSTTCCVDANNDGDCADGGEPGLTSGVKDPEDCDGANGCNGTEGASACKKDNAQSCGANSECITAHCECVDASCGARECAAGSTTCCVDANNDGDCADGGEPGLTSGVEDPEDCDGVNSCNGSEGAGACKKDSAQTCASNSECVSTHCECIDSTCSSRECAAGSTTCCFDPNNDGDCDDAGELALTPGTPDPEDCDGTSSCNGTEGVVGCTATNGQTCTANSQCVTGHCECVDVGCSARECSSGSTTCCVDADNNGTCDGPLSSGTNDPEDCEGANSCNGTSGASGCKKDTAQTCAANSECLSTHCECIDSGCATRECASGSTTCCVDADNNGTCDGPLSSGTNDPEDCEGANSCNGTSGAAGCKKDNAETCGANSECLSTHCECIDSGCATRECSSGSTTCCVDADNNGTCDGPLSSGTNDPEDCEGANSCNGTSGAAGCKKDNAQTCAANSECLSTHCECIDSGCATRECSSGSTTCCVDADNNGTCDGPLSSGTNDPEDCEGTNSCNGTSGATGCKKDNTQACAANSECVSTHCECTNVGCTSRACSAGSTTCCVDGNSDGDCNDGSEPGLTAGVEDPEDCEGTSSCNGSEGATACKADNGQTCSVDGDCSSIQCECGNSTCVSSRCSDSVCAVCKWTTDGVGVCDGDIDEGSDPGNLCAGASTCDGHGACKKTNGSGCTNNYECINVCVSGTCNDLSSTGGACDAGDGNADCVGGHTCSGGVCLLNNGQAACTGNGDCLSGNCECIDSACVGRICSENAWQCEWDVDGVGVSSGDMDIGSQDLNSCFGTTGCTGTTTDCECGAGAACLRGLGSECTNNTDCASNNCTGAPTKTCQ